MMYSDFFSGQILVKILWSDKTETYWRYVEGRITDENDELLTLEDAYIYTSYHRLYRVKSVVINKEYIDSVDSANKGEIIEIAKMKYKKLHLNWFRYYLMFSISALIAFGMFLLL